MDITIFAREINIFLKDIDTFIVDINTYSKDIDTFLMVINTFYDYISNLKSAEVGIPHKNQIILRTLVEILQNAATILRTLAGILHDPRAILHNLGGILQKQPLLIFPSQNIAMIRVFSHLIPSKMVLLKKSECLLWICWMN